MSKSFVDQVESKRPQLEELGLAKYLDGYLLEAKLYQAIKDGSIEKVNECLQEYAKPNVKPTRLFKFLLLPPAFAMKYFHDLEEDWENAPYWQNMLNLLKAPYWPIKDEDNNSYLHHAVMAQNHYAVMHLLSTGVYDIHEINDDGESAISIAKCNKDAQIIKLLSEYVGGK